MVKPVVKRALCVGINDYPYEGNDLKGCVNDAQAWAELLTTHFDFPADQVVVMEDSEATRANMLAALQNLLRDAQPDDVLVFTNSSHGSYIADTDGDESKYDEILCPYDIADQVIVDDELRELFTPLPDGVHLAAILDNCFSGTATRAIPGIPTPDERRIRFLNPELRGDVRIPDPWGAKPNRREKYPESGMKDVLLSGCTDKQYSYDALIDGTYHGAMTYHAIKAIREANYSLTYSQLHQRLTSLLNDTNYDQDPQLEGKAANKERPIFS